ncbi:Hypothetical protein NGAL_HAMBI2605_38170 [Neorhizobium galegae bv. orientalis]|uniref:hypothetical protein n=1 Tax=Neorhizobium vignae TaxID=690585 RepID=UPI000620E9F8|nr:hypothetical protein [Neorhizobium vignae]CDZ65544.1 Hypothetical protein NGAL_HAMBI2605_38170 [Neorhizobium galegae bv. orientalis]
MTEYFYLDVHGRMLGSLQAWSFRDAHAWLARQGIVYHEITKFRPRTRKARDRRLTSA